MHSFLYLLHPPNGIILLMLGDICICFAVCFGSVFLIPSWFVLCLSRLFVIEVRHENHSFLFLICIFIICSDYYASLFLVSQYLMQSISLVFDQFCCGSACYSFGHCLLWYWSEMFFRITWCINSVWKLYWLPNIVFDA